MHDSEYYLESSIFLVENKLFKVPKYMLVAESTVFRDMFALPSGENGAKVEGTSDENPIVLEDTRAEDFIALLKILYPFKRRDSTFFGSGHRLTNLNSVSGSGVLKLATRWMFDDIRKETISAMDEILAGSKNTLVRVLLGREHRMSSWLLSGYQDFVTQARSMTLEEGNALGMEVVIKLNALRDEYNQSRFKQFIPTPAPAPASAPTPTPAPSSLFASLPTSTTPHRGMFGQPAPNAPSMFGSPSASTASSPSLFTQSPASSRPYFSFSAPSSASTNTAATGGGFGAFGQPVPSPPAPSEPGAVEQAIQAAFKDEIKGWSSS